MPHFIRDALNESKLMGAYRARPPYQQNDYIGWVTRAKLEATRQKRLNQMLDELKKGNVYMKMEWTKSHTLFCGCFRYYLTYHPLAECVSSPPPDQRLCAPVSGCDDMPAPRDSFDSSLSASGCGLRAGEGMFLSEPLISLA